MDFKNELNQLNINLSTDMLNSFNLYYEELIRVNEYMNLTAITEKEEVYLKHFYDSLTIIKAINPTESIKLCDVGSGAGFPSIPLAICYDSVDVTIIDALNKRINFLNELTKKLSLKNVNSIHARAEEYVKEKREFFDVVTARAVARLNVLAELCLPLVKINGYFIAMKASSANEELEEAKNGINILGGKVEKVIEFNLPNDAGLRQIIVIKKIKETPKKYPRIFNNIKEKPL